MWSVNNDFEITFHLVDHSGNLSVIGKIVSRYMYTQVHCKQILLKLVSSYLYTQVLCKLSLGNLYTVHIHSGTL